MSKSVSELVNNKEDIIPFERFNQNENSEAKIIKLASFFKK